MPKSEPAHHISYFRCTCGCEGLTLRLHRENGDVIGTAEFSRVEASKLTASLLVMVSGDSIGRVAGNA